jgi:hypothetical protein
MSGRRQPPSLLPPLRGVGSVPTISGAYRIIAPRSAGRELSDLELDFSDETDDPLELGCVPSSHQPRGVVAPRMLPPALEHREVMSVRRVDAPPSSRARTSSQHLSDSRAAVVAFAGFGEPPDSIWGTPAYAMRVLDRRRTLRAGLVRARERRSHDVELYEASLEAADSAAVRKGILVGLASVAIIVAICAQAITGALVLPW